jgi:hypothetical protein
MKHLGLRTLDICVYIHFTDVCFMHALKFNVGIFIQLLVHEGNS